MKKISLSLLAVVTSLSLCANGLSLRDRMYLRSLAPAPTIGKSVSANSKIKSMSRGGINVQQAQYVSAIAQLNGDNAVADLEAEGAQVAPLRHGFAVITMRTSDVERIAQHKSIKMMSLQRPVQQKMKVARSVAGIDKVHQGIELPQGYTGKDVVCGIVDGGFDPNHVNFLNPDGTTRIETLGVATMMSDGSVKMSYYTENMPGYKSPLELTTDDFTTYHGTHTMGIMAGGYAGQVTEAYPDEAMQSVKMREVQNPYYGVAYNANLAVGAGSGYDALIAYNLENIIGYAQAVEKPCVINLSLGSTQGPHDGTTTLSQFLDECSEKDGVIFCLAAGNEGDMPIALHKTFTAENNVMQTFFDPYLLEDEEVEVSPGVVVKRGRYGTFMIYSDTKEEFQMQVFVYNKERKRMAWSKTLEGSMEGSGVYYVTGESWKYYDTDIVDASLGSYYEGYLGFGSDVDKTSGRYTAIIELNMWENEANGGKYLLGFKVTGKDGQRVDVYGDALYAALTDFDIDGYDDGMTDGTISDMACGKNVISVGAWNCSPAWATLGADYLAYSSEYVTQDDVTWYSSYGTLIDGRTLPDLVAPGLTIISSFSKPFVDANKSEATEDIFSAKYVSDKRTNYWYAMAGTSMATPVVSGIIALMLEANPTLNYADVREILRRTAVKDEYMLAAPPAKVGAGKVDAYAAVKAALNFSGIDDVKTRKAPLVRAVGANCYEVFVPGANALNAVVYNIAGSQVDSRVATGNEATFDLSGLAPGIYVMHINGQHAIKLQIK